MRVADRLRALGRAPLGHARRRPRAGAPLRPRLPRDRSRAGAAAGAPVGIALHLSPQMTDSNTFIPRRRLGNGHWMTLFCWGVPRTLAAARAGGAFFQVTARHAGARALLLAARAPDASDAPRAARTRRLEQRALHARHGRQGAARRLQRRPAQPAQLRRHRAPRTRPVSLRTDRGSPRSSSASSRAPTRIDRVVVAGYSLGGNLALRLAGTHSPADLPSAQGGLRRVAGAGARNCVRALERRSNFVYQWNFVRNLKTRMRRKNARFPGGFDLSNLGSIRTVRAVRRRLHRAVLRLRQRRGLLSSRGRAARARADPGPRAHHHRGGRSVRAGRAVPRPELRGEPQRHAGGHRSTAATAGFSASRTTATTATGRNSNRGVRRRRRTVAARAWKV